jgi:hypothetical protein
VELFGEFPEQFLGVCLQLNHLTNQPGEVLDPLVFHAVE